MKARLVAAACGLALIVIAMRSPLSINLHNIAKLHAARPSSGRVALSSLASGCPDVDGTARPNDPAALALRGDAEWQCGHLDQARANWTAAGDFRRLVDAGSYLVRVGKWESADAMYMATAKIPSSGAAGLLDAAALHWNRGDKEGALRDYEWLVRNRPADCGPIPFANLATLYGERHEFALSDSILQRGLARWPKDVLLRTAAGMTYARSGRTRLADDILTHVWSEDRTATGACYWLAWTKEREGADEAAAAQYRDCLSVKPGDAPSHYQLGTVLVRLKRPAEARQQFLLALQDDPSFRAAHDRLRELE